MPVPDYETLMLPVLRLFAAGARNVAECVPHIQSEFGISDEEAQELIPSGRITVLQSRAHWARTYLSKAGLLDSPSRNLHVITDKGRALLDQKPARIDNATLAQFEGFAEWVQRSKSGAAQDDPDAQASPPVVDDSQTPEDAMEAASAIINAALVDELGEAIRGVTPQRFERLILDLLIAMGYGGGDIENGRMTKATGDGGIDGIINEDALGLDAVYVQAKKYAADNTVGRPEIQRFVGSLTGEGATKGVFVTTSSFSREAREYVSRIQQRVVLIDGVALAQLLVKHGVGVRQRAVYVIKDVDRDYFADSASPPFQLRRQPPVALPTASGIVANARDANGIALGFDSVADRHGNRAVSLAVDGVENPTRVERKRPELDQSVLPELRDGHLPGGHVAHPVREAVAIPSTGLNKRARAGQRDKLVVSIGYGMRGQAIRSAHEAFEQPGQGRTRAHGGDSLGYHLVSRP